MKKFLAVLLIIMVPVFVFLSGPRLVSGELNSVLPSIDIDINRVEQYVLSKEATFNIRPDNEARIIWNNDSLKNQTEYSILYLHGFCASWYEGYPVNINLGKALNANVYLSRLHDHGLDTHEGLFDMRPDKLYESAKEALMIASVLGEKIIVVGTSTGGTLALMLAADFPEMVDALVLLSPNIAINNPISYVLTWPWGLQIARLTGDRTPYRKLGPAPDKEEFYWYRTYRWEGVVYLGQLINATMKPELFQKVEQTVFLGYYYKNEEEQDEVVRVDAMLEMYNQLSTPEKLKHKVAFPDANAHVIGCEATSGSYREVEAEVSHFIKEVFDIE